MTGDYDGDCIVRRFGDVHLEVLHADPRTLIAKVLLDEIRAGGAHPAVSLVGDVLTIRASNRTVIYRLGEYLPESGCYRAEWPD